MPTKRDRRGLYATRDEGATEVWIWRGLPSKRNSIGTFQSNANKAKALFGLHYLIFEEAYGFFIRTGEGPVKLVAGRAK